MSLAAPPTIVVHPRAPSVPSLILAHLLLAVGAFLFGPTIYKQFLPSKLDHMVQWQAHDLAEGIPAWSARHPGACPRLSDVVPPRIQAVDAWGHDFVVRCGDGTIRVVSAGEDGEPDTDDDIRWPG